MFCSHVRYRSCLKIRAAKLTPDSSTVERQVRQQNAKLQLTPLTRNVNRGDVLFRRSPTPSSPVDFRMLLRLLLVRSGGEIDFRFFIDRYRVSNVDSVGTACCSDSWAPTRRDTPEINVAADTEEASSSPASESRGRKAISSRELFTSITPHQRTLIGGVELSVALSTRSVLML